LDGRGVPAPVAGGVVEGGALDDGGVDVGVLGGAVVLGGDVLGAVVDGGVLGGVVDGTVVDGGLVDVDGCVVCVGLVGDVAGCDAVVVAGAVLLGAPTCCSVAIGSIARPESQVFMNSCQACAGRSRPYSGPP